MGHADLVAFAVSAVISAGGALALVIHAFRPPPKDRLILWIGVFAVLYGIRLVLSVGPVSVVFIMPRHAAYVAWAISYVIIVPAILFVEELYGKGWRGSMRWLAVLAAAYAAVAITINIAIRDPVRAPDPAFLLFGPGLALVFVAGWRSGYRPNPFPEWRLVLAGFLVFIGFVIHEHAVSAGLLPWNLHIESIGMLAFNGCLGYVALSRFFTRTRQLAAIDKELEAARQIQSSILPRELPSATGIDIAIRYEPLAAVAGDFYDVVPAGGGAVSVLLADVSGHGVPAALIASMVKVAFVAQARRTDDPAAILDGMNRTLCGMFERAYVTAACARVDRTSVRYALAGHPPPVLVSSDGRVSVLDRRGLFIGMFPSATYSSETIAVPNGARLILYTDGVTEASAPGSDDLFGLDRLKDLARATVDLRVRAFADKLMAEVTTFARAPLHDDVTVVAVDVGQGPARNAPGVPSAAAAAARPAG